MHPLPAVPHTVCFGQTRKVDWQSTISVGGAIYSVPHALVEERVWARIDGSELIVVHVDSPDGPREVARHRADHAGTAGDQGRALSAPPGGRAGAQAPGARRARSRRSWRSGPAPRRG